MAKNKREAPEILAEMQKKAGQVRDQQLKEKLEDPALVNRFKFVKR